MEAPPGAVPFSRLFACADRLGWVLMAMESLAAAAHDTALVVYLHYIVKIIHLLRLYEADITRDELFHEFTELALIIVYIAAAVFVSARIDRWCLIIAGMGIVTVVANFLQHFYFGIMGEKMTERVRRMMFSAMLWNKVGFFNEENSVDNLSMRLANDATFVRAAFSNRLSIFIQDTAAFIVVLIGMLLGWRLALVALATLLVLVISAVAQVVELQRAMCIALENGRRAIDKNQPASEQKLIKWAKLYLADQSKVVQVMDIRLEGQYTIDAMQKVASLALLCYDSGYENEFGCPHVSARS